MQDFVNGKALHLFSRGLQGRRSAAITRGNFVKLAASQSPSQNCRAANIGKTATRRIILASVVNASKRRCRGLIRPCMHVTQAIHKWSISVNFLNWSTGVQLLMKHPSVLGGFMVAASMTQSVFFCVSDCSADHILYWFSFLHILCQYVTIKSPNIDVDIDGSDSRLKHSVRACWCCWSEMAFVFMCSLN